MHLSKYPDIMRKQLAMDQERNVKPKRAIN
jgi:hypothetical protein